MVWLYAEPEDGYELAGFSLVKKEDGQYTKADLLTSTWTDNENFTDPYAGDDEFVVNVNCARTEDANSNDHDGDGEKAREAARAKTIGVKNLMLPFTLCSYRRVLCCPMASQQVFLL